MSKKKKKKKKSNSYPIITLPAGSGCLLTILTLGLVHARRAKP